MELRVSDDLGALEIYAEAVEQETVLGMRVGQDEPVLVHTIADPVLMTDTAKIGALPSGLRDALMSLYQSYPRTVRYDDVAVSWSPQRYPRVWCPSIDTIFFARALRRHLPGARAIAEIGTGSGYLTKFALVHGADVRQAVATDISMAALHCASDNVAGVANAAALSLVAPQPDAPDLALHGRYDLIFTNPPYIPRPQALADNPYEGLSVLAKLARDADQLLSEDGKILLNISSLSGPEPLSWFTDVGLTVTEQDTMRVPFKINAVTSELSRESRAWMDYLRGQGRLDEDAGERSGYRYWHTLRMFVVSRTAA